MTKTPLNLIARFKAKPGREADLHAILDAMVAPTRAEPGCINYDLHRSQDDASRFVLYEGWRGKADLDAHMAAPHFTRMLRQLEDVVAEHGDGGKPFRGEALTMLTDRAG